MLVKLRVNQSTFDDILSRIVAAEPDTDRISFSREDRYAISLRDIAIVVDEKEPRKGE